MFKFLFGFDMQIIYEILIIVAIILLIVLMIKFKSFRIFGGILFYILFLIVSAFALFNVNNYYSSKGGIIGELSDLIKPSANVKAVRIGCFQTRFLAKRLERRQRLCRPTGSLDGRTRHEQKQSQAG